MLKLADDDTGKASSFRAVVEELERVLELAKTGEVEQVAIAWTNQDGGVNHTYGLARKVQPAALLGAIDLLAHDLRDEMRAARGT